VFPGTLLNGSYSFDSIFNRGCILLLEDIGHTRRLERVQLTNHKGIDSNFLETVDSHRLKPDGPLQASNTNIAETHSNFITGNGGFTEISE